MKSQAITEYGAALQEVEAETPNPSGNEVLVEISHCGVCHSDVHFHDGHFDMGGGNQLDVRGARQTPFTLGHEIEGIVTAIGDDVKDVKVGERRVIYPWIGCGDCIAQQPLHSGGLRWSQNISGRSHGRNTRISKPCGGQDGAN